MTRFCVVRLVPGDRQQIAIDAFGNPLTWHSWVGASRFAAMNGGTVTDFVTPVSDVDGFVRYSTPIVTTD